MRITEQAWPAATRPLVSINCMAYNHEKFVADAIEGFLRQETTFPVEILIHDDASTDKTADVIREYERRHPEPFRPVYQAKNQYSRGKGPGVHNVKRARGEFIAMCEGDDYWTDSHKLQKQVDFLQSNPDCVGCIHDAQMIDETGKVLMESCINRQAGRYTRDDCVEWLLSGYPSASLVFRRAALQDAPRYLRKTMRDTMLDIAITKHGDLGVLDACMSVYRKHAGGMWTSGSKILRYLNNYEMFNELLRDDELLALYGETLSRHLDTTRRKIAAEAAALLYIKQSLSWKITKPLRYLRRLLDPCDSGVD